MRSSASSQPMRRNWPLPFGPVRSSGWVSRSGWCDALGVARDLRADHPGGVRVVRAAHRADADAVDHLHVQRAGGRAVMRADRMPGDGGYAHPQTLPQGGPQGKELMHRSRRFAMAHRSGDGFDEHRHATRSVRHGSARAVGAVRPAGRRAGRAARRLRSGGRVAGGASGPWTVVPALVLLGIAQSALFAPVHETMHLTAFAQPPGQCGGRVARRLPVPAELAFLHRVPPGPSPLHPGPGAGSGADAAPASRAGRLPAARAGSELLAGAGQGAGGLLARRPVGLPVRSGGTGGAGDRQRALDDRVRRAPGYRLGVVCSTGGRRSCSGCCRR